MQIFPEIPMIGRLYPAKSHRNHTKSVKEESSYINYGKFKVCSWHLVSDFTPAV